MIQYCYRNSQLHCENLAITEIAAEVGTPLYLYSRQTYLQNLHDLDRAFGDRDHLICYALKANSNPDILRDFAGRSIGADVVSAGELQLALQAGIPAQNIVFAGGGKRDDEIIAALEAGIRGLNVESEAELRVIDQLAGERGKKANVSLRVNPNIDIHGHPYISTGRHVDKFGIEYEKVKSLLKEIVQFENVRLVGLHAHVGSQITELSPFKQTGAVMAELAADAASAGHQLDYLDLGGGLGVIYENAIPVGENTAPVNGFAVDPAEAIPLLTGSLGSFSGKLLLEPGRSLVATCGVLITRVLYVKETLGKYFVFVDAGMTDLIRPSLYNSYHQIVPVTAKDTATRQYEIVGPICESGDFLGKERELPVVHRGDLLAIMTAGAYGFSLSSNYNARPRPPEVIVDRDELKISRKRESLEEIWQVS